MKGEAVPRGQTWQGNPASLGPAKSGQAVTGSLRKPVGNTGRSAAARRTVRIAPWRRIPEPQQTIADVLSAGGTAQRRRIVVKIMTPSRRGMTFSARSNG